MTELQIESEYLTVTETLALGWIDGCCQGGGERYTNYGKQVSLIEAPRQLAARCAQAGAKTDRIATSSIGRRPLPMAMAVGTSRGSMSRTHLEQATTTNYFGPQNKMRSIETMIAFSHKPKYCSH